ncbi:MAG: peptidylprolyl isomerase [Candidatus Melainabacteria bacterium]|nr:peptidylprolyl isomerase [Candidatus Melainabacteria bacterium]
MEKPTMKRRLRHVWTYILCLCLSYLNIPVQGQATDPVVVMQTTKGPIVMRIYLSAVPTTASNFLDLVSRGFYNGLTFHRVESWVVQGGDPNGNGTGVFIDPQTGQPRYLRLESIRMLSHNAPGVIAMAHGKSPNSASCQFYITKKPMPALDGAYAIFGGVIQGMETVYNMQPGDRILSAEITGKPQRRPESSTNREAPTGDSGF